MATRSGSAEGRSILLTTGYEFELIFNGQVCIRDGLCLDALGCINHEHGAFTGRQGPGDLVVEVDMARGINEVELEVLAIALVVDRDGRGLDGDATFTLQVH